MAIAPFHLRIGNGSGYNLHNFCKLFLLPVNLPYLKTKTNFQLQFRVPCSSATACTSRSPSYGNMSIAANPKTSSSSAEPLASDEGLSFTPTSGKPKEKFQDELPFPNIDKSGRFCNPRAARELALLTIYSACLQGSDPVRLFDKRLNAPREAGYEFDHKCLLEYNIMSFAGPPVTAYSLEEETQLVSQSNAESDTEAQVLLAPPKLVYSKLLLRFARKLLAAVVDQWDDHVLVIDKVAPRTWKNQPTGRILELSILHLAMSEITVVGTRHQIVINEAVDLAKRYCDGAAPRIINGCLRTFVKDIEEEPITILQKKARKQWIRASAEG